MRWLLRCLLAWLHFAYDFSWTAYDDLVDRLTAVPDDWLPASTTHQEEP